MPWPLMIVLDAQSYPLPVVQRVAYALANRLSILVSQQAQRIQLEVSRPPAIPRAELDPDAARVLIVQTLNDFVLRERIQQETAGVRELLAKAALRPCGL